MQLEGSNWNPDGFPQRHTRSRREVALQDRSQEDLGPGDRSWDRSAVLGPVFAREAWLREGIQRVLLSLNVPSSILKSSPHLLGG